MFLFRLISEKETRQIERSFQAPNLLPRRKRKRIIPHIPLSPNFYHRNKEKGEQKTKITENMAQGDGRVNWKDSHLYFSREKEKKKKTKKGNEEQSPLSISLSLSLSFSSPFFRARHARETSGRIIRYPRIFYPRARHVTTWQFLPTLSRGSQRRSGAFRFLGRRARLRGALRSAGD